MSKDNIAFQKSIDDAALSIVLRMFNKVQKVCILIESDAKKESPVDMGILRASITHDAVLEPSEIIGYIGSSLEYAPNVHQGTGIYAIDGKGRKTPWGYVVKTGKYKGFHWTQGQKPNPFLKRAVEMNKEKVSKMLGD